LVATLIEKAKSQVPDVKVEEVDVAANPAVAMKYRVMSTPAIAINGKLEFTGIPRKQALLERLQSVAHPRGGDFT
jgi:predicted thioredoxin/glutaredoxin